MDVYENLKRLGIELQEPPKALGLYRPNQEFLSGRLIYTSGAGCRKGKAPLYTGKVGREVTLEEGKLCARQCVINLLCGLQNTLGDLNRVNRVVKVLGFVASADGFYDQPKVIDGASCLLSEIFGEAGVGARSAVGVYSLPGNIPVEVEMLLELHPAD